MDADAYLGKGLAENAAKLTRAHKAYTNAVAETGGEVPPFEQWYQEQYGEAAPTPGVTSRATQGARRVFRDGGVVTLNRSFSKQR